MAMRLVRLLQNGILSSEIIIVNFLLEENYILTAFELLQHFNDPSIFPPNQISRFNSLSCISLFLIPSF